MLRTPLHGIDNIFETKQRIIKTDLVCEVGIKTNAQFMIPFRTAHKFLWLQRVKRIYRKGCIGQVHVDDARIVVLVVVGAYSKIEFVCPGFGISNRTAQLVGKIGNRVIGDILVKLGRACIYTGRKTGSRPGTRIYGMAPGDIKCLRRGKFLLRIIGQYARPLHGEVQRTIIAVPLSICGRHKQCPAAI